LCSRGQPAPSQVRQPFDTRRSGESLSRQWPNDLMAAWQTEARIELAIVRTGVFARKYGLGFSVARPDRATAAFLSCGEVRWAPLCQGQCTRLSH
jgi:hypothetical protein